MPDSVTMMIDAVKSVRSATTPTAHAAAFWLLAAALATAFGCGGDTRIPPVPSATYSITGVVSDSHTSLAIAGASVTVVGGASSGQTGTTDSSGRFVLSNVTAGAVTLRASQALYEDSDQAINVAANVAVTFRLTAKSPAPQTPPAGAPLVRAIYLVPSDRHENDVYARRIEQALRGLQAWYRDQLGAGRTFVLSTPPVGVVHTPHPAAWYPGNGSLAAFFYNGQSDARAADPGWSNETLVVYVDADIACGQSGAALLGTAVLPANDLRGLNSEPLVRICPGDSTVDVGFCRWVGGLGHELGHGFGLPHPPGCDTGAGCSTTALMGLGYITYPNAALLDSDKAVLGASRFFLPFTPGTVPYCY